MTHEHHPVTISFQIIDEEHNKIQVTFHDNPNIPDDGVTDFLPRETVVVYERDSEDTGIAFMGLNMFMNNLMMDRAAERAKMTNEYLAAHPEEEAELQEKAAQVLLERLASGLVPKAYEELAAQSLGNYYANTSNDEGTGNYL